MAYDFSDPQVADLIRSTHAPKEYPSSPNEPERLEPLVLTLLCCRCLNTWPCPPIQQYRAFVLKPISRGEVPREFPQTLTTDMVSRMR